MSPADPTENRRGTEQAAHTLSIELRAIEVLTPDEIPAGFEIAATGGAEGLVVLPNPIFWNQRGRIVALAAQYRLPTIYPEQEFAENGGFLAYGPSVPSAFRRTAGH